MAHGQHHLPRSNPLTAGEHHRLHRLVDRAALEELHAGFKAHLAAQLLDLLPQSPHHGGEFEGADMGPVQGEDFGIGTRGHQFFKHLAHQGLGLAHLAVELAVGEGACPPLPELGIRFRVEGPDPFPEPKGVGGALFDRLAALEQEGVEAHLGQQQGCEIAAGPRANHHRSRQLG